MVLKLWKVNFGFVLFFLGVVIQVQPTPNKETLSHGREKGKEG